MSGATAIHSPIVTSAARQYPMVPTPTSGATMPQKSMTTHVLRKKLAPAEGMSRMGRQPTEDLPC